MKTKIISALLLGCLMTGFTACHSDLDMNQESYFTSRNMWTDENDANMAVNGMFSRFRSTTAENLMLWGDLRANLQKSGAVNDAFFGTTGSSQKIVPGNSGTDWTNLYRIINDANLIIKHVDDVKYIDPSKRDNALGNALFVRAYCYYMVARIWGDAPLLISGFESENQEDMYPSRGPVADIFAQIEKDLDEAISVMPKAKDLHKGSKGAINMLRADYFLWKASRLGGGQAYYQKAKDAADAVIGGGYTLLPVFADIFKLDNKSNNELIFTFPYVQGENVTAGSSPNYFSYYLAPGSDTPKLEALGFTQDDCPSGSHAQYVVPTDEYMEFLLADPTDQRGTASVLKITNQTIIEDCLVDRMFVKFKGRWSSGTRVFDNDMPIYRLAEAYLLKAEACNGLGDTNGAMAALNVIAKRARGVDNYYTGLDKTGITDAIIDESKMEFACESKMWWVYLRTNTEFQKISSLVGKENVTNITLWPISNNCITTNSKITQTPGYN